MTDNAVAIPTKSKLLIYIAFMILFWFPFTALLYFKVSGSTALSAAVIGVLPLLVLFTPAFSRLFERLTSLKVGNVEVGFQEAIKESLEAESTDQVSITVDVDTGREDIIYGKAKMEDFLETIKRYKHNRNQKLVISVDLKEEKYIYIPMLYFQIRTLFHFFDARAVLFINTAASNIEQRILGAMQPVNALNAINKYLQGTEEIFANMFKDIYDDESNDELEDLASRHWSQFTSRIMAFNDKELRLTNKIYIEYFADKLERNIIEYPVPENDYPALLKYLEPDNTLLILVQNNKVINVRTIDRVAREIARLNVIASMKGK